jgi:DNA invertase Pin-like site-specific DNA recombinase
MDCMDVYVRVSKVGKRSGESYRSPALQREAVNALAKREGIAEAKVITDEDVSGGTAHTDRGIEELIARAEKGITQGVMVDTIDRLGRTMLDGCLAIKRLKDAGARIISAEGDDSSRPDGMKNIHFRLMVAEDYLENVRRRWKRASESAAASGIQCARAPIGYMRGEDGRLVVDPLVAEAVRQAFKLRATGSSFTEATKPIEAALGGRVLSRNTLARMVVNRTYLGEVRRGDVVTKDAHEAIVTPELFAAAGSKEKVAKRPRQASAAELTYLSGLIVCAGCDGPMKVQRDARTGSLSYVCSPGRVGKPCPPGSRAALAVAKADGYVQSFLGGADGELELVDERPDPALAWLAAKDRLQRADAELDEWIEDDETSPDTRKRAIVKAEAKVEAARAALYALDNPDLDGVDVVQGTLIPATHDAYRRMLAKFIKEVRVCASDPARRRWQPVHERVEIVWQPGVSVHQRQAALSKQLRQRIRHA